MFTPRLVLVTCPDRENARKLAGLVLENRLAACVNIIPEVESHYRWEGKIESSTEFLLLIKSSAENFSHMEKLISSQHPYACPEIIALSSAEILPQYRVWWEDSIAEDHPKAVGTEADVADIRPA
jgi:periplasmic divalent cation tolerance protein